MTYPWHLMPKIPLQVFGTFFLGCGQAVGLWHPPHRSSDWRGTELRDGLCGLFWHLVCPCFLAECYVSAGGECPVLLGAGSNGGMVRLGRCAVKGSYCSGTSPTLYLS